MIWHGLLFHVTECVLLRMRAPQRDDDCCSSFDAAFVTELLRSLTAIRISRDYLLLIANRYILFYLQILNFKH